MKRFLAAAALLCVAATFPVGCAPVPVPSDPGDISTISRNIAYAEEFVRTAEIAAHTCIALKLPICSSPAFAAGVRKAEAVAEEALAEAEGYPVNGSTQDRINAALRVAMNAVLLFNSLR